MTTIQNGEKTFFFINWLDAVVTKEQMKKQFPWPELEWVENATLTKICYKGGFWWTETEWKQIDIQQQLEINKPRNKTHTTVSECSFKMSDETKVTKNFVYPSFGTRKWLDCLQTKTFTYSALLYLLVICFWAFWLSSLRDGRSSLHTSTCSSLPHLKMQKLVKIRKIEIKIISTYQQKVRVNVAGLGNTNIRIIF